MKRIYSYVAALLLCGLTWQNASGQSPTDEPCTAPALTVNASGADCAVSATFSINPPVYTNSTSASAGVTLPAMSCNPTNASGSGTFSATTLDMWYTLVVPSDGKFVLTFSSTASNVFFDWVMYTSSSTTCAGSTFTEIPNSCQSVNGAAGSTLITGRTPGELIYIRTWREAAYAQNAPRTTTFCANAAPAAPPASCATYTAPANGATGVAFSPNVTFTIGNVATATSYKVYFGTVNPPALLGTATAASGASTTFTYGTGLTASTTYYWYVVPTNSAGDAVGCASNVQSFTTALPPTSCATYTAPANGATNVTYNPATPALTWNNVATATGYKLFFGTATPPTQNLSTVTAQTGATTGISITDLAPNTTYYWYVVPTNGGADAVGCASVVQSFTTEAEPIITISAAQGQQYCETFTLAYQATSLNPNAAAFWDRQTTGTSADGTAATATNPMYRANFYNNLAGRRAALTTPQFNLSAATLPVVDFFVAYSGYAAENDSLAVQASSDGGTTWTTVWFKSRATVPSLRTMPLLSTALYLPAAASDWRHESINLSAYAGQANVRLRWVAYSQFGNALYLDNIRMGNASAAYMVSPSAATDYSGAGLKINFTNAGTAGGNLKMYRFDAAPGGTIATAATGQCTTGGSTGAAATSISPKQWWLVTYDGADADGKAAVNYDLTVLSSLAIGTGITSTPSKYVDLRLLRRISTCPTTINWREQVSCPDGGVDTKTLALNIFSDFGVGGGSPLAVEMLSFTGKNEGSVNLLNWATASETNNAGFEVETSRNGQNFEKIGFVASKNVAGNSNIKTVYNFAHNKPVSGANFYRLRQIDIDGKSTYSSVVKVNVSGTKLDISAFAPNPVNDFMNCMVYAPKASDLSVTIIDVLGKVVSTQQMNVLEGNTTLELNASGLNAGIYQLTITDGQGSRVTQKFIKQ